MKLKKNYARWISVVLLIVVWQILSSLIGSEVILPGPYSVMRNLVLFFGEKSFYCNIGATILRAVESFAIIVVSGAVLGLLAAKSETLEIMIRPLIAVFKATPVMSVVLIAFIWFRTGAVPVFSAFLMAFPVMFVQTVRGYKNLDIRLIQMCDVYNVTGAKRLIRFTLPAMMPSLITGAKQSLSMIWKVIIAAEVLTVSEFGVGKDLQLSQVQLETSKVFAWTVIAILLTSFSDMVLDFVLKRIAGRRMINETH